MAKRKSSKQPITHSPGFIREEIGSGITKKTRTRFTGPLNAEGFELLKGALDRVADPFREVEMICREDLRRAGVPDDPTEGGKYPFRSYITDAIAGEAYHSRTWYAAAILDQLAARKWSLEVGDMRGFEHAEGRARYLYRERYIKSEYEKPVEIGKRKQRMQTELAKRKHEKYRAANEAEKQIWQSAAEAVWAKNKHLYATDVAPIIKRKLNLTVTVDWIRKNIRKPIA